MEERSYHLILGSNLGDRVHQLQAAQELLSARAGNIIKASKIYQTQPWGFDDQPWFLNQAVELRSTKPPLELLAICKQIEKELGREPGEKWHARHIDIDILLCGTLVFHEGPLTIPHPRLQDRQFVLIPLMEIAPDLVHPISGKTIEELFAVCRDTGEVYIFSADEQGNPL